MIFAISNTKRFTSTMVAPVGVASVYDKSSPITKATHEMQALEISTDLKLWKRDLADRVGNTIRLEMRSAPMRRMPMTTTHEQRIAKIVLKSPVLMPMARANFSSKVMAKI